MAHGGAAAANVAAASAPDPRHSPSEIINCDELATATAAWLNNSIQQPTKRGEMVVALGQVERNKEWMLYYLFLHGVLRRGRFCATLDHQLQPGGTTFHTSLHPSDIDRGGGDDEQRYLLRVPHLYQDALITRQEAAHTGPSLLHLHPFPAPVPPPASWCGAAVASQQFYTLP